jgi:hypothetical protein
VPSTVDRKQLTRPIECELNGKRARVRKERKGEESKLKGKAEEMSNHDQSLCDAQTVKLITANTVLMATTSAATLEGLYVS